MKPFKQFITEEDDDMSDMFDTMADMFSDKPVYYMSCQLGTTNIEAIKMDTAEFYERISGIMQDTDLRNSTCLKHIKDVDVTAKFFIQKSISIDTGVQDMMRFLAAGDIILMSLDYGWPAPDYNIECCRDKEKLKRFYIVEQANLIKQFYRDSASQNSVAIIYQKYIDKLNALP